MSIDIKIFNIKNSYKLAHYQDNYRKLKTLLRGVLKERARLYYLCLCTPWKKFGTNYTARTMWKGTS